MGGKKRKHLIGPCSIIKAEAARERARDILEKARTGKDHNAEERASRVAPTVKDLSVEHLQIQKPPKISERYYLDKKAHWSTHILPVLGKIKVADLSRADVEKFHGRFKDQPALGNSCLATLSKALSDCLDFNPPWRTDNPCARIEKFRVQGRERILSKEEVASVFQRIAELKARGDNDRLWSVPWLIELLLTTGLRLRELSNRRWSEIDLDNGTLTIPKPKASKKPRHVTLSQVAIDTLRAMPRRSEWVFPNSLGSGPFVSPQKHWERMRKDLGLSDVRVHDFRHTVASYAMHEGGLSQREVMELLGHRQMATTERYLNVHDERKRSISDRAAGSILGL